LLKKSFFLSVLFCVAIFIQKVAAQNLFANPGLEDINICTEYNAACAPEAWYYIKPTTNPVVNKLVAPKALLGKNILFVPMHNVFDASRSFVYSMLICPLVKGDRYRLSFYINTSKRVFYNLDFYFSEKEPATVNFITNGLTPTFSITPDNITAEVKQDWYAAEYEFTASGNEQFCMLGNLSAPMPYGISDKMNANGNVFYFLDELKLVSLTNQSLCANNQANLKKIYAQNYRHTDFVLVDSEAITPKRPQFITDTITVPSVFFETNSAVLKPSFIKIMDSISAVIGTKKLAKIDVIGHTDDRGTPEKNNVLSLARAESVKNYFNKKLPQYADIIFTFGKGQDEPVSDNKTEEGRMKNRRVEIILTTIEIK
jgi:outer membrane protein OmpA-like peptidoglycan-associated protein